MMSRTFAPALVAAGVFYLAGIPANAGNLMITQFAGVQTFNAPGNLVLADSGSFFQSFDSEGPQNVMISFSAVCSTSGKGSEATSIQIILDGAAVYPTNKADNLFCSVGGGKGTKDGLNTNAIITAVPVGGGTHTVQVTVTPLKGGTSRIDNLSMLVWN